MKIKWVILIIICIMLFVIPSTSMSQTDGPNGSGINLTMEIKYFAGSGGGNGQSCIAFNEKDKEKLSACQKWEEKIFKKEATIKNNVNTYPNKANYFLQETAEELYGVNFPKTYNNPVKINDLYTNYETLGWVEVDPASSKIGTLAIFPNIGGFIVKDGIIYFPSSKKGGLPVTMKLEYLGSMETVKYIIPRSLIEKK